MIDKETLSQLQSAVDELKMGGRYDELLRIIGVPTLQQLNIEAAKAHLSPLVITKDYRFILTDYNNAEVDIAPIHKALYILFLNHPEGVEFKRLVEHREELLSLYKEIGNRISIEKIEESVNRLVNPLDNSINEKCARIKAAFSSLMDVYQLNYYVISSHTVRHIEGTSKVWFERKKTITLPRNLVSFPK